MDEVTEIQTQVMAAFKINIYYVILHYSNCTLELCSPYERIKSYWLSTYYVSDTGILIDIN